MNVASRISLSKYRNTLPCWSAIDKLLRQYLNSFHHLLGCDAVDPADAAELFSTIVRELLLEHKVIVCKSEHRGPHRQHPIETALRNLSHMKNAARKSINTAHDTFVQLVRAHHSVKRCYSN